MNNHKLTHEHTGPIAALPQTPPSDAELHELNNPNVGNPDAEPGADTPDQRPITDNKAGG